MPNRVLKESICSSANLDMLTSFQETVFYRLIVNCDDFGRMDARPKLLASLLFPLKDIRVNQIEDSLRALASAELVTLYEVGGQPFLQINTWNRHQRIRDSKEKYPGPEKADCRNSRQVAANCGELRRVAASCGQNPIQSESESESNPKNAHADADAMFASFWAAYPRHTNKKAAILAFLRLNPDEALLATILSAVGKQKQSAQWTKDGGQFIPHPATWLNGRRWEDEIPDAGSGKTVSAQKYGQRAYTEDELLRASYDLIEEAKQTRGDGNGR